MWFFCTRSNYLGCILHLSLCPSGVSTGQSVRALMMSSTTSHPEIDVILLNFNVTSLHFIYRGQISVVNDITSYAIVQILYIISIAGFCATSPLIAKSVFLLFFISYYNIYLKCDYFSLERSFISVLPKDTILTCFIAEYQNFQLMTSLHLKFDW